MPDDVDLEAPQETPSDASAPAEDESETPSDETPEEETETAEGGKPPEDEPESEPAKEASAEDDEDEAWRNFNKKFDHIKSERDRRAAQGRAFWEKTRYASQVRKENEDLKARLARLEAQVPAARDEKPEEPTTPPPELARIDARIQALYQKDQGIQEQQNKQLQALAAADKEVGVIEDRMKDADDYQKAILEQRMETAKFKRESILNRWADLNDKREGIAEQMEQRLADRDWTTKFLRDQANRVQQEQASLEQFNVEFPKHVDGLIVSVADELGAPKDETVRKALWKSVNRAMMVDLWQLGEEGLQDVNVPGLVRAHVKEYLEERDLVGRTKFSKTSTEKLKVTARAGEKPPSRPAAPPKQTAISPALLSHGDLPPAMRRARELLTKRYGGG